MEVISLILFHFLERHKIEKLAGCTLQRVALRGGGGGKEKKKTGGIAHFGRRALYAQ